MTRDRDDPWPRRLTTQANEEIIAAVDTLAALVADAPPPTPGWWRRREVSRNLDERLRELGRRVALGPSTAVLLDPALRAEAGEIRRLWRDLHPRTTPGDPGLTATELVATVEELRRRFEGIERLLRPARAAPARAVDAPSARPRSLSSRAARR